MLTAACLITGCSSSDDGEDLTARKRIVFSRTVVKGISRAVITDKEMKNPYDKAEKFKIFCGKYRNNDINPEEVFYGTHAAEYNAEGEVAYYHEVFICRSLNFEKV